MEKVIVSCPNCERKVRVPDEKRVKYVCPGCQAENIADNRPLMIVYKHRIKQLGAFLLVFILLCICMAFVNDYRLYQKVSSLQSERTISRYESNNITGFYNEDFQVLKIEFTRNPDLIILFHQGYPDSDYLKRVDATLESVWDESLNRLTSLMAKDTLLDNDVAVQLEKKLISFKNQEINQLDKSEVGSLNEHERALYESIQRELDTKEVIPIPPVKVIEEYGCLITAVYSEFSSSESLAACAGKGRYSNRIFHKTIKFYQVFQSKNLPEIREYLQRISWHTDTKEYECFEIPLIVVYEELWQEQLDAIRLRTRNYRGEKLKTAQNLYKMLVHLKDSYSSEIKLTVSGFKNVKDFTQYSATIKKNMNEYYQRYDGRNVSDNILSMSQKYREGDVNDYEEIVQKAILKGFGNFIPSGYVKIEATTEEYYGNSPHIVIHYQIRNQTRSYDGFVEP